MNVPAFSALHALIVEHCPDLSDAPVVWHTSGYDSLAADVADRWIFKFPRRATAAARLALEARLLGVIRPSVIMTVPDMTCFAGPPLFTRHRKIPGGPITPDTYAWMPARARDQLADDLGRFYAELHGIDRQSLETRGATAVEAWLPPDETLRRTHPLLSPALRSFATDVVDRWQRQGADPLGETYGFFDGHGGNMAFDADARRLAGVFDFGDSGTGALHQEFIYSNFIARELTDGIITAYEHHTTRAIDRDRVAVLTGVHRLWELAVVAGNPTREAEILPYVTAWANR